MGSRKVLCIDDTPDEVLPSGKTLRQALEEAFRGTGYRVLFRKTPDEGVKTALKDRAVALLLLDIIFNGRAEGSRIADEIYRGRPELKVIVLTRVDERGKKISFGWKPNVVHYVVKNELSSDDMVVKLGNLTKAVVEDYYNKNWELVYSNSSITITNKVTGFSCGVDIPPSMNEAIRVAIKKPNVPVDNPGGSVQGGEYASLNKLINTLNSKVLEATKWQTWGILTREGCAKGQFKLLVGSAKDEKKEDETVVLTREEYNSLLRKIETLERELTRLKAK
jgi:hypothetical protein